MRCQGQSAIFQSPTGRSGRPKSQTVSGFWVREIGWSPTRTDEAKLQPAGCETRYTKNRPIPNAAIAERPHSGMGKWKERDE